MPKLGLGAKPPPTTSERLPAGVSRALGQRSYQAGDGQSGTAHEYLAHLKNVASRNATPARLIVLHGPRIGLHHDLKDTVTTIGRGAECDICLPLDNVSRLHARVERRDDGRFVLVDCGSTNGTYLNERELGSGVEAVLESGALIHIGGSTSKFLAGGEIEALYFEEIHQLAITDGLSGLRNQRYFVEVLARELARCRRFDRPVSLLLLEVDRLARLTDENGHQVRDWLLRQIAAILGRTLHEEECLAHLGDGLFARVLPETPLPEAAQVAEGMRATVEEAELVYEGRRIHATVSVGVADRGGSTTVDDFIARAELHVRDASVKGGNRVEVGSSATLEVESPRISSPRALVSDCAGNHAKGASVLAFEVLADAELLKRVGRAQLRAWLDEALSHLRSMLSDQDRLAVWSDSILLVGLAFGGASRRQKLLAEFAERWGTPPVMASGERSRAPSVGASRGRPLKCAVLEAANLSAGIDELDLLRSRLASIAPVMEPELTTVLPFPLVALHALVPTRRTSLGRLNLLFDAVECALKFLAAVGLARLTREHGGEERRQALIAPRSQGPLTMGSWLALCRAVSDVLPRSSDVVCRALHGVWDPGRRGADIAERLEHIVTLRNEVAHSVTHLEDAYAERVQPTANTYRDFLEALAPLRGALLASVAQMEFIDEGLVRYELFVHAGPREPFPIEPRELTAHLQKGWTYLIDDEARALLLAPILAAPYVEQSKRVELCTASGLATSSTQENIVVRGITTNHEVRIPLPRRRR